MTFVIEALGLTSGGGKAGLMRLLPALARHTEHRFVAILADLPDFTFLARPNLKVIVRAKPRSLLAREIHLQRMVPSICRTERADALLCLGNFAPRRCAVPAVVLLHNAHFVMRHRVSGAHVTLRERLVTWYGRRMMRRLPAGARLVVQTELMKQRVCAQYLQMASRVTVIPDADGLPFDVLSESRNPCTPSPGVDRANRCGVPFTFICMAHYYPHKNLEALVDAFRELRTLTRRAARCLLTIDVRLHPGARRLLDRIESAGLADVLVNVGPLSGERVAQAYRSADAFILPTLLESFGRTYCEAMRCGLPILTSDRDFAHDACGAAALYFDPLRPAAIARSMAQIMESSELRSRLSHAGLRRAADAPSWDEIAARFVRVLEEARGETPEDWRPQSRAWCDIRSRVLGTREPADAGSR